MELESRVRTLEVHVLGNGAPGIIQRMKTMEDKTSNQEDRIDRLEFKTENKMSREECLMVQHGLDEVMEKAIERAFRRKSNTGMKLILEWVTKLGPTLAGIGAILASISALQ